MSELVVIAFALAVIAHLLVRGPVVGKSAALAALVLGPVTLALTVIGDEEVSFDRVSTAPLAAAGAAGVFALVLLTTTFVKRPNWFVMAALVALPLRIPVPLGGESVKLLVPLYGVIGAGVLASAWRHWRGQPETVRRPLRLLDVALATMIGLYAMQLLYSSDSDVAIQNLTFFYGPFALLYVQVVGANWDRRQVRNALAVLVGLAVVFVGVGFYEFATERLLIQPPAVQTNDFDPYFRVQSLFFDPNIYGRFVAVSILLLAAVMTFTAKSSRVALTVGLIAVLWAGLLTTLSQSSFLALIGGLVVLAATRWSARPVVAVTAFAILVSASVIAFAPDVAKIDLSGQRGLEKTTSGRLDLVAGGAKMFGNRPFAGYGSGSFSREFIRQDLSHGPRTTTKSHTTPLTVAAEQGLLGIAAYVFVLVAAMRVLFWRLKAPDQVARVARVGIAAAFVALIIHSLVYAAFFEDPLVWTVLAVGVALQRVVRTR